MMLCKTSETSFENIFNTRLELRQWILLKADLLEIVLSHKTQEMASESTFK